MTGDVPRCSACGMYMYPSDFNGGVHVCPQGYKTLLDIPLGVFGENEAHGRAKGLEEAAALCDKLGDDEFRRLAKHGNNSGIAKLAQRHYLRCASEIRALIPK